MHKEREVRRTKALRELNHRRQVLEVAKGLSATLGSDYFQSIVTHLAAAFNADYVFLAEVCDGAADRIRILAAAPVQEIPCDFGYDVSGTAAGQTLSDGEFARGRDIRRLFPTDSLIGKFEADGFIGARLSDSMGQPIGMIAMIAKEGFPNVHLAKSVLEAFVPRTAAELERKRFDEVHRENEERYHAFIATNPDAMWRIEFEQPIPLSLAEEELVERIFRLGYIAEANGALAKLADVADLDQLVGSRFADVSARFNPGSREEIVSAIRTRFQSKTAEVTTVDPSGQNVYRLRSHFAIVENDSLRRIWGTTRDISELRRTELSLRAAEKRFRAILEGIQLPALMLSTNGEALFANPAFLMLAQRSWEEISRLKWLDGLIPGRDAETWMAALIPDKRGGFAPLHFEGELLPHQGSLRLIAWDIIGLRGQGEEPAYLAAIGRDITRQKAMELEVLQAKKLEGIGRFAAGAAHDFNNMLTLILGHATQLLGSVPQSDPNHKRLEAIEKAVAQCSRLTGQLLAFGRKQPMRPALIELNELIHTEEALLRGMISDRVTLVLRLQSPLGLVYADPDQIRRVLANLVGNANDAMPDGGQLLITTGNFTLESESEEYPGVSAGPYVELSVIDTGIGLSEEVRARLFEPFFTTKMPGKGTGLGLAAVYGIVTQSGGHIVVQSEPKMGTRFGVLLPAARES
jgi:PAS domain S-box-containing protein